MAGTQRKAGEWRGDDSPDSKIVKHLVKECVNGHVQPALDERRKKQRGAETENRKEQCVAEKSGGEDSRKLKRMRVWAYA